MDPLDFLENDELLRFLHSNKTELSCMVNPQTFLNQLRDHNLILEDKYKRMSHMKSKETLKKALYEFLDWFETERSEHIKLFWGSVFKETIINHYPILRILRNSLMDGSFRFDIQLPEKAEKEVRDKDRGNDEEGEEEKANSAKRKQKKRSRALSDSEEEQAGPSSAVTPSQRKKTKKMYFYDKDKNGNEESDLEDQPSTSSGQRSSLFSEEEEDTGEPAEQQPQACTDRKSVFKVTCAALFGTLHEKRFASGTRGKSIRTEMSWMTPVEFVKVATGHMDALWRRDIKWEGKPLSVLTEAEILKIHNVNCTCKLCKPDAHDVEDQKNDDECFICKSDQGNLVECDKCPRSFHQQCHLPHVGDALCGDKSVWMCTFCVFKSNQEWFYRDEMNREVAMSSQISQHMLECQYLLLRLWGADEEQTFATNPSLYLEDYSTVINNPMWLGSIADKLQQQLYQTVGQFVSDVELIFANFASYNRDNAEFLAMGNKLKKIFDDEVKNLFNIL